MSEPLHEELAWPLLQKMLLIRRFEEALLRLSNENQFIGHYHLYIGQEATGSALISLLDPRDRLATTHRNHGHVLARGADPGRAMAEILGRASGLYGGRGGTIHLGDPDLGFISTSGMVGGCISLGVGAGYACRQLGQGAISAVFFGDGALEEGISFEALNIASLWHLPVLFICENNSMGSWAPGQGYPTLVHASSDLCNIAKSVNIVTMRVDGADVFAVHSVGTEAIALCRAGEGPVFLEAVTKRWPGSNPLWPEPVTGMTDLRTATGEIAPAGEHADWLLKHDPVLRLAGTLASADGAAARLFSLDAAVHHRIDEAVKFALSSPFPAVETANERVFA